MTVSMQSLDEMLLSDEFVVNPYPAYERLRAEAPVYYCQPIGAWLISRYDDIAATLMDPAHLSSRGRFGGVLRHLTDHERGHLLPMTRHFSIGLIASDPPDHNRMRHIVNRKFTPRVLENLRPRIETLVDQLLTEAMQRHEFDLLAEFAYPLPAIVIAELLGAPPEDRDRFKHWSDGILSFQGTGQASFALLDNAQRSLMDMRAYLEEQVERKRSEPGEDLLSLLVVASDEEERLSMQELLTLCVTMLTAGHETTTNLIANGVYMLINNPEQRELLRANPGLMPSAIEEMLRYEAPLQRNPRRVAEDFELRGQTLREGDFVLQILGSGNYDPEQFPDPYRFDITRKPNRHLTFGHGIHFCLGAPLGRLEAGIALGEILRRMPTLELVRDQQDWLRHGLIRGMSSLPVRW
jgi:cytochrome P450